ncbi:MAG TPA: VanZ family protein [Candidatus Polarisedimenticolaceae bacterium]
MTHGRPRAVWIPVLVCAAVFFAVAMQRDMGAVGRIWDKAVHATGYALFGVLALRAAHGGWRDPARGAVALAGAVTIGHGACVEILQAFVPWREASVGDVAADALGFAIGLALYAAYPRRAD